MKKASLVAMLTLATVFLAGCDEPIPLRGPDQCLRAELFKQCLAAVPVSPLVVGKNSEWSSVVSECESAAYRQSWRTLKYVKPECKS